MVPSPYSNFKLVQNCFRQFSTFFYSLFTSHRIYCLLKGKWVPLIIYILLVLINLFTTTQINNENLSAIPQEALNLSLQNKNIILTFPNIFSGPIDLFNFIWYLSCDSRPPINLLFVFKNHELIFLSSFPVRRLTMTFK